MTTAEHVWERQPGETLKAFHAFAHYRSLAASERSQDRAYRDHLQTCLHAAQMPTRRRPKRWAEWSSRWAWPERAAAFDAHLDRQKRNALEQEQIEAGKRHGRMLQAAQNALLVPIRVSLEEAASGAGLETLRSAARANASGLRAAVDQARMAAAHLAQLIGMERLVLGLTTDRHEVLDAPVRDVVAEAIVSSQEATSAAVQLLHAISRATPSAEDSR